MNKCTCIIDFTREVVGENSTVDKPFIIRCPRCVAVEKLFPKLVEFAEHDSRCDVTFIGGWSPDEGGTFKGKQVKEKPPCTCGLDALLAEAKEVLR